MVATLPKNSISSKKKLQPFSSQNPYDSSFELVVVSECYKKKQEVSFDLLCLWVPGAGLEPAQPQWSQDFKSCVSTIPPSGH
jgi:hypothetical protein